MPTYEYECLKCHKNFDIFQSMKDDSLKVCPKTKCRMKTWGHGRVKRKVGAGAGFIFKGSGFYITDYRSENYKEGAKKDAPASAAPAGDSSKPAETAKPKAEPAAAPAKAPEPAKPAAPAAKTPGGGAST